MAVSSQGWLRMGDAPRTVVSPGGRLRMTVTPRIQGSCWNATLRIEDIGGGSQVLRDVAGAAFFLSDLGYVVALEPAPSPREPSAVRLYDLAGRLLWRGELLAPHSPVLSANGRYWGCASPQGILRLDLATFESQWFSALWPYAISPNGSVAGLRGDRVLLFDTAGHEVTTGEASPASRPQRLAFSPDGSELLLLCGDGLVALDTRSARARVLFRAPPGGRLRDLRVEGDLIAIGIRRSAGEEFAGELFILDSAGAVLARRAGARQRIPAAALGPRPARGIPWPLAPNEQHRVGNTYGEYQYYGGEPYLHPGVDVMGDPGQAVFAVQGGEVKAVLTTGGQWHWRVAISDSATSAPSNGYLYAHLAEASIAVDIGEPVVAGQYLGDLVEWPLYGFTHIHFARIRDEGEQWGGAWLCTDNPHLDFQNQSETEAPFFEPALGNDLLAFCVNETSDYVDPTALAGEVDIIAHAADRIHDDWDCTVQEIRYTIYRLGFPELPVIDDRLAVRFDMALDTYQGGPIDPFLVGLLYKDDAVCDTEGDYGTREFFHVITNSDGDEEYEPSDQWEAWDTRGLPDGDYLIRVTLRDVVGNLTIDSMLVTTANEDPSGLAVVETDPLLRWASSNPARDGTAVGLEMPSAGRVRLAILDAGGRLVRRICDTALPAGGHRLSWDGRTERGAAAAAGVYFWRLSTAAGNESRRIVLTGK